MDELVTEWEHVELRPNGTRRVPVEVNGFGRPTRYVELKAWIRVERRWRCTLTPMENGMTWCERVPEYREVEM